MATTQARLMTDEDLSKVCNDGLDVFLNNMINEGELTDEQANHLQTFRIVVNSRGFFGSLLDKLFKSNADRSIFTVVKVLSTKEN
jgi:hypothetical protein